MIHHTSTDSRRDGSRVATNAPVNESLAGLAPRIRNGLSDVRLAVDLFRGPAIVSPAQKSKVFRLGAAPAPFRSFMIELEKTPSS